MRTYTTVDCGIWDDAEFCAMSAGAQRTYFMLISQREITACGVLSLTLRRWGRTCSGKDLDAWLAELSDNRYVIIDEDSEELLVRTFAKWDGGYKHAKRVQAVIATSKAIRSHSLRTAAVCELAKLGVSIGNTVPTDRQPVGTPEATDSLRVVVTEGEYESTPQPSTHKREPLPPESDNGPSPFCSKHPTGTENPCGPCGTAKMRAAAWTKAEPERKRRAAADRAQAVADCVSCDADGWLLTDSGDASSLHCDHRKRSFA
jgi:hypothetical protein